MSRLRSKRMAVKNVDHHQRLTMYSIFKQYYIHTDFDRFCSHMDEKDHVLILWAKNGGNPQLGGFTTVVRRTCRQPFPHVTIFSGDTVIDKEFWASKSLQKAFFWYILETKLLALGKPVYWFLICKGHKTYLMMRKNFPHSFPNPKNDTPEAMKTVMDNYYSEKYKHSYCSKTNLIRFNGDSEATRKEYYDMNPDILNDSDVTFFLKNNPDFAKGVELACIAEIRWKEFINHIYKFFIKLFWDKWVSPMIRS